MRRRRAAEPARGRLAAAAVALVVAALPAPALGQDAPAGDTTLVPPPYAHTLGIHRARPVHLKLFLGDRTRFDDPQGLAAVKLASDDDPEATGDDFQLTLFGVNAGRGEILYNSSMQTLGLYGGEGDGPGRFREPRGIAATVDGRIYVADHGNDRVARLAWDPIGRSLGWVGAWPVAEPFGVAVDARGNVYVTATESDAVLRFADPPPDAAEPLPPAPIEGDRWPLPDDVEDVVDLAVGDSLDPWYRPPDVRLLLVDRDGERLRAYDPSGAILGEAAPPTGGRFGYVELDYYGNVYVTDRPAGAVHKFDPDLELLTTFHGPPDEDLDEPRGIAIWRRFGQVFVAEREGAQYYFVGTDFGPTGDTLAVADHGAGWSFEVDLTEAANVTVAFLAAAGDTLATADAGVHQVGPQTIAWTPSAWTREPAEGWRQRASRVVVEARPTYSSRKRFSRIRSYAIAWRGPEAAGLTPSRDAE